jgi:CheY-like chemotaxis protein
LDVNASVGEIVNMLKHLIGEDVKLETRLASQPCMVMVDAGQIEQVYLNLAVNARDAMPRGGTLTFETGIIAVREEFSLRHPDLPRGPLVLLTVRDTGCGMSDEIKLRIFEPFFTTKEKDRGTGLGLSMVYGIIKQSGGDIEVESSPNRVTTFRIYFPEIAAPAPNQGKDDDDDKGKAGVPGGNETVLLVEDEETIRRLAVRALTNKGYSVLSAADGKEALKVLERHGRAVDLLITDVVMPGMSGRELAQAIASMNMVRRTLFISGFTDEAIVNHGVLEAGLAFMYKPFSPDAILRKIRKILDGPADQAKV